MSGPLILSPSSATTAGILLLSLVGVEYGGLFLVRVNKGDVGATDFQKAFFRAGHAHAGVLLILSLIMLLYCDAVGASGIQGALARGGVPFAAIFMPLGFFLSPIGPGRDRPNKLIVLLYVGATGLALGVVSLGIALLTR